MNQKKKRRALAGLSFSLTSKWNGYFRDRFPVGRR